MKIALNIFCSVDQQYLVLEALMPERFTNYGFGTFLENVDPKEVQITRLALEMLEKEQERRGLNGLEFWPDFRLAWGSLSLKFLVEAGDINLPAKAKEWVRQFRIKELNPWDESEEKT